MFRKIIQTEWRILFAERSFLILAVLFAMLLVYAVSSSARWIDEKQTESRSLLEKQETSLAESKSKTAEKLARGEPGANAPTNTAPAPNDPNALGMSLQHAVLPFNPAAIFSLGQADVLPLEQGVTISTLQRTKADKVGFENPLGFLAGRFDLSFVIVYLLPIFVLALGFNLLSNEREQGILQLLLSQPIRLKNLLTAKIAAQFALVFSFAGVVSIVCVSLFVPDFSVDFWLRAALWTALTGVYAAFWFALAALVNSYGFSSSGNAVALVACWLVLVLILPSLLNVGITAAYPVPSRHEMISAVRNVNLDMRRDGSRLLAEHYQDHPELMPKDGKTDVNDFSLAFVYIQREQKKRVEEIENRFAGQLAGQQNLIGILRFLSPSIIAQEASNDIAGTGIARFQNFREQVKDFDRAWDAYFTPKIFRKEALGVADFEQIPRFAFREEPLASVAGRVAPGILFLAALTAVLMFAAFRKLKNFQLER